MQRNMNRWMEDLRDSRTRKPMPVLSFPGIQLLDISVRDLVDDGDMQARCMKAIADRYDTAASLSNMDLSVEAEAFGAAVIYSDVEVPTVTGRLVNTEEEALSLPVPEVGAGRTGEYIKGVAKALKLITDRPVLAGVIGPFSLAGRLLDMTEIMIKCMVEPDTAHAVLEKVTEFITKYILAFKAAGANGIVMAEPAAGLLSPSLCMEFSSAYVKRIIETVEDESFIVVYHNCGSTAPLVDAIIATGARAIHLGNAVRLEDVLERYPEDMIIMGNLDPCSVLRHGTAESVRTATLDLLERLEVYPNWVLSTGCDIPPMTPLGNIDAFFDAAAEYCSDDEDDEDCESISA